MPRGQGILQLEVIGVRNALGQFASWETALDKASRSRVQQALETVRRAMAIEAPRGKGAGPHFADQFRIRTFITGPGSIGGEIYIAGPKARMLPWITLGVRPHPIDASPGKNLVFNWEKRGVLFVGPHVNHPGTRPNDFATRAVARVEATTLTQLRQIVNEVIVGVQGFEGAGDLNPNGF